MLSNWSVLPLSFLAFIFSGLFFYFILFIWHDNWCFPYTPYIVALMCSTLYHLAQSSKDTVSSWSPNRQPWHAKHLAVTQLPGWQPACSHVNKIHKLYWKYATNLWNYQKRLSINNIISREGGEGGVSQKLTFANRGGHQGKVNF